MARRARRRSRTTLAQDRLDRDRRARIVVAALVGAAAARPLGYHHFIVTTERLMSRECVIKRTGIDIPMARISSVQFSHTVLDRLFGCGTFSIESAMA